MFARISLLSVVIVGFVVFTGSYMNAESSVIPPTTIQPSTPIQKPNISTDVWGIFDPKTGLVITGENIQDIRPIASISKLFTAATVLESTKKDDAFEIIESDILTEGRSGKLVAGVHMTPYELLFPLLIESSNDAGAAIKRTMGPEFGSTIQEMISTLGLNDTQIFEPTGLRPENTSSVTDLSRFYAFLRETHPHILDITKLNIYVDSRTGYKNSDPAQKLQNFVGGKQGYTDEAGRTFVGSFLLPNSSKEVGIVILGSTQLLTDIQSLLSYADAMNISSDILLKP